jgi:hypothetical protein
MSPDLNSTNESPPDSVDRRKRLSLQALRAGEVEPSAPARAESLTATAIPNPFKGVP